MVDYAHVFIFSKKIGVLALPLLVSCGGSVDVQPVGTKCASNDDCSSNGATRCATDALRITPNAPTYGFVLPDSTCISDACAIPTSGIRLCDEGHGYCYQPYPNASTLCLPLCTFQDGTAASGCAASDSCQFRHAADSNGLVTGYGTCYFGCVSNTDCSQGLQCQVEFGACVSTLNSFSYQIGTPCTIADDGVNCNCLWSWSTQAGYCTQACRIGDTASVCSSDYVCDAELPAADSYGAPLFTQPPSAGLRGHCLKPCATDIDCAAFNGYCYASGGMTQPTCKSNPRTWP